MANSDGWIFDIGVRANVLCNAFGPYLEGYVAWLGATRARVEAVFGVAIKFYANVAIEVVPYRA